MGTASAWPSQGRQTRSSSCGELFGLWTTGDRRPGCARQASGKYEQSTRNREVSESSPALGAIRGATCPGCAGGPVDPALTCATWIQIPRLTAPRTGTAGRTLLPTLRRTPRTTRPPTPDRRPARRRHRRRDRRGRGRRPGHRTGRSTRSPTTPRPASSTASSCSAQAETLRTCPHPTARPSRPRRTGRQSRPCPTGRQSRPCPTGRQSRRCPTTSTVPDGRQRPLC
jgi:hypothetical protein